MHRRSFAARALAALVGSSLALFAGACSDQTSILVRVTSSLTVPDDIDQLELHVAGEPSGMAVDRSFDLSTGFPQTVSLRPGPTVNGMIRIEVTARHGGTFVARRVVHTEFVSGRTQTVEIEIYAACRGTTCPDGVDCGSDGRCVGGGPDGGIDGGRDGGGEDAGPDGGAPECTDPSMCDDAIDCTLDACTDGVCFHTPDSSLCQDGFTCDPVDDCPLRTCTQDDQCDDRRACNGVETCGADMVCRPGTPIDCDDADPCTVDSCSDPLRGECLHATRDVDGDMHGDATCASVGGVVADDCDDANPAVLPGTPEDCNGLDDDCEGGCDEDFTCCRGTVGTCTTTCGTMGTRTCNASCGWSVCSPPVEICNAVDDDCNGAPDDVFACVQGATRGCTTGCGSSGTQTCGGDCTWGACEAPAESCNGRDDDCNGTPDDGFGCVQGTSTACTTSCGTTGSRACGADCTLSATCTPPPEGCNGVDDNCNGMIDETNECAPGTSTSCTTSCGTTGSRTCSASCTYGACSPPAETCNGNDDDCDGRVDETFTCVPGSTGTCTSGCSTVGSRTCSASCSWGACTPPAESCNGRDDDCDAMCDDGFACCAGSSGSCTTSCGTTGTRTCSGSCGWSACSPPAETCNGADDDCNGACDDTFACCAGRTYACTTSCGSTGTRVCTSGCTLPTTTCTPPAEACGGGDNDCDGNVDEGFACSPGATGPCTTSCGTTGVRTCDPFCAWGTCTPPTEACNGVDDNCNGMTDEGCGSCTGCTGAVAIAGTGGRYPQATTSSVQTGSCGGAGSEHVLSFTLAATSDVFITTHAAVGINTVLYVRSCGCTGPEMGCNNDADGRTTSALRLSGLAPGTYQVFVDTQSSPLGTTVPVDIYITPPGPASDRCGNPTAIAPGTAALSGSTCTFGGDYDLVNAGFTDCSLTSAGDAEDRVFYFSLASGATVTFNGCQSGGAYDSTFYLRSVCNDGTGANQLACNDDGCTGAGSCTAGWRSSFTSTLPAGLYYLFVDGYGGSSCQCGNYQVAITGL